MADRSRLFAAGLAAAALALAHPAVAQSRSPRSETPAPGVTGSVVGYQESAGSAILYHEEKGGMVTQVPPPIPAKKPVAATKKSVPNGASKTPAPVASKLAQQ